MFQLKNTYDIGFLVFSFLCIGCQSSFSEENKEDSKIQTNKVENMHSRNDEKLLYFFLTTDITCCNPNAIAGTDCGDGYIYFTSKGNVVFHFNCMEDNGEVSAKYDVGTYKKTSNGITITFDRAYNYQEEKLVTHSDDALIFVIELINKNCNGVLYCFSDEQPDFKYAVVEANPAKTKHFFNLFRIHKILQEL